MPAIYTSMYTSISGFRCNKGRVPACCNPKAVFLRHVLVASLGFGGSSCAAKRSAISWPRAHCASVERCSSSGSSSCRRACGLASTVATPGMRSASCAARTRSTKGRAPRVVWTATCTMGSSGTPSRSRKAASRRGSLAEKAAALSSQSQSDSPWYHSSPLSRAPRRLASAARVRWMAFSNSSPPGAHWSMLVLPTAHGTRPMTA
mmetsp:Transcript_13308/g.34180  ORF Transcript_13308/g.34180 Transcript_13308/m.34180 type:complete len:205 (-) Transcript_13308:29-643(-)